MVNVLISPAHRRKLSRLFTRLRAQHREDANEITRRQLSDVINPDGSLRDYLEAGPLAGDVTGTNPDNRVVGIQTVPVLADAPAHGDVLSFDGTAWTPTAISGLHRWEPVTNGDVDAPELVFDNGDIVMEEILS